MHYSTATLLAFAAGTIAQGYVPASNVSYVTVWTTALTTVCPGPTSFVHGSSTYTITEATTLTITDCPCTKVIPMSEMMSDAIQYTPAVPAPAAASIAAPVVAQPSYAASAPAAAAPAPAAPVPAVPSAASPVAAAPPHVASAASGLTATAASPVYAPVGTGSYTAPAASKFTGAGNTNAGLSIAGLAGVAALAFAL